MSSWRSLNMVCLESSFAPTLAAIEADLEAVALQHGDADPHRAARSAIRRSSREIADLLQRMRCEVASDAR